MWIRPATNEDAGAISELILPLARRYITDEFPPEGAARFVESCSPAAIGELRKQGVRYLVAQDLGDIVGVVGVRDGSHLYHLFVANAAQGCGLGRELWNAARSRLVRPTASTAITVNSSRNAVAFYERLGFERAGSADVRGGVTSYPMRLTLD